MHFVRGSAFAVYSRIERHLESQSLGIALATTMVGLGNLPYSDTIEAAAKALTMSRRELRSLMIVGLRLTAGLFGPGLACFR